MKSTTRVDSHLCVWEMTGLKPRLVGTLDLWDSPSFRAEFRYADTWRTDADAYALDPINLPLSQKVFATASRFEVMGAIFDAAPDAWGRTVMAASLGSHPTQLPEREVLLIGRGTGVGAIGFSKAGTTLHKTSSFEPILEDVELIFRATQEALANNGTVIDDNLAPFVTSSWDIGGARPKAVVTDQEGYKWIAKFPGKDDPFSCQRVEWANLQMARKIGINVPEARLIELSSGDAALLVKRFDRSIDDDARRHYLSAVSLISPPSNFDKRQMDTPHGARYFSYAAIAEVAKKISSNYKADVGELYVRMALNVLLHNTDDHLKNHGFIKDVKGDGYRLSPLFDVVSQRTTDNNHFIHIGPKGREGTLENLLAGARSMGLSSKFAETVALPAVQEVLAQRADFYAQAGLSAHEQALLEKHLSSEIAPMQSTGKTVRVDADPEAPPSLGM